MPFSKYGSIYTQNIFNNKEYIDKTLIFKAAGKDICPICHCSLQNDLIRKLNCTHEFHIECIDKWTQNNDSCPQCRSNVTFMGKNE